MTPAGHIYVSAVRYALTRSTYIVGMTVDEIIRLWSDIPERDRMVIERDIRDAMAHPYQTMWDKDKREWQRLIDRIEQ